jgi:hypothetical protein
MRHLGLIVSINAVHQRMRTIASINYPAKHRAATSCCLLLSLCSISASQGAAPRPVRFNEHIRPIFTRHCTECHGGVKQASELSFIYPQQVLPPDGWVVEPGKPDESVLIERVASDDVEFRMPPAEHGSALSKKEIAVLREWIRQGAEWERPCMTRTSPKAPTMMLAGLRSL